MKKIFQYTLAASALSLLQANAFAQTPAPQEDHPLNVAAIVMFLIFVAATLLITKWAATRTKTASDFYTAGGGVTGFQNGLAIAGDYMSAASFLGISATVMASGYDGLTYSIGFLVGWPLIVFLIADRLRNLGRFTFSDVAGFRFAPAPIRTLAATGTLVVVILYLIAQMVGAGSLIKDLFGLSYNYAVIIVGVLMIIYVLFGGMTATTWVQIIKACLLLAGASFMALMVLWNFGFDINAMFTKAIEIKTEIAMNDAALLKKATEAAALQGTSVEQLLPEMAAKQGTSIMSPGNFLKDPISAISFGMALMFGTAGLPHILMRFFTVPDAKQARASVLWATTWIGYFYVLTFIIGFGAIIYVANNPEFLTEGGKVRSAGTMPAVFLAKEVGGDLFYGFISAVAFATILAVVSGLTLSGASAISHDLYSTVLRKGKTEPGAELKISRITTLALGVIAVILGILFEDMNVAFMVSLAFAVAASTNFPVLILSLLWRGMTTRGALIGGFMGLSCSVVLTILSESVWVKVLDNPAGSQIFPYTSPAIFSIPLAFFGIWFFSITDRSERAAIDKAGYDAQMVRAETGVGAAEASNH